MTARPWVAIAGNPNTGKTTLFNALTGQSAKVSNYPGVTVDRHSGTLALASGEIELVDIPGTYSLVARSAEEQIAIEHLTGMKGTAPAAVIVCADATQLSRTLYLLMQVQELGLPCIVALTMIDEAGDAAPDPRELARVLGCEAVAVVARKRTGLPELTLAVERAVAKAEHTERWRWEPSAALAAHLDAIVPVMPETWTGRRALALWALQSVDHEDELEGISPALRAAVHDRVKGAAGAARGEDSGGSADGGGARSPHGAAGAARGEDSGGSADGGGARSPHGAAGAARGEDSGGSADGGGARSPHGIDDEVVQARWRWLDAKVTPLVARAVSRHRTERIDRVLMHRVVGFAAFLGIMFLVFMSLFAWSDPAIKAIASMFGWLGTHLRHVLPAGVIADFVVDGLIGGVGTVLQFLPQILLLFLLLGLLEDCGYLARVAYLMDRIMRAMNLHGRAFVPMLSGFACAVPAVAATRTMERRRDRILTMLVVPLMTCSARLPVYTLVIAAMIRGGRMTQSLLMVGMYLFSAVTALIAAWVLSKSMKPLRAKRLPFVIELPPYRWPRLRDVVRMMWGKSSMFLREAGTVILACSIALWALLYFPRHLPAGAPDYAAQIEKAPTDEARTTLEHQRDGELLRNSFGGRLGHIIEPAIAPLGFDWKIGIGIIGAFAAREVFISTMGVVYSVGGDVDEHSPSLREALHNEKRADGSPAYTPLVGLSLMLFFALACQCMSTLAVVKRETGGYRWPVFLFTYMTVLAWLVSFGVYQVGRLLGFS